MAKIALVLTDNVLYKNDYVNRLVQKCSDSIELIIELNFKHPSTNSYKHTLRYLKLLGVKGVLFIGFLTVGNFFKKLFANISETKNGYSLQQIANKNGIKYVHITNINSDESIALLEKYSIDYVINSGNQIFREKILKKYENRILNRHTSLLPAYGGIYPIYWQLLNGDTNGGVTLHWVDKKIDRGTIAYQKSFTVDKKRSLFYHYKLAFEISLELCITAINDLNNNEVISITMIGDPSYYSWPEKKDIENFFKLGLKIV
ncbi:hypothetical protein BH10BAC5_BH10BAC5_11490 [soil metagenome]